MELKCYDFDIDALNGNFFLEPHGDHQIGSHLVDYDKIEERISALKEQKNRYTIIMGDIIDNITAYAGGAADRRWSADVVDDRYKTPERQCDKFLSLYMPVKRKILGILSGNHEWKTIDRYRFKREFCDPLGVPYLGQMCMINIAFMRGKKKISGFEIWAAHGSYMGMQPGGAINRLKALAGQYAADVYLHAHTHDKLWYSDHQVTHAVENNSLGQKPKIYVITGTFQKTHVVGVDSYMEKRPQPRVSKVGTITLEFDPIEGKVHAHE